LLATGLKEQNFVKEYIDLANDEYAAVAKQDHKREVERRHAALRSRIAQEEARIRILQKVQL
jgi:hypothetical protein